MIFLPAKIHIFLTTSMNSAQDSPPHTDQGPDAEENTEGCMVLHSCKDDALQDTAQCNTTDEVLIECSVIANSTKAPIIVNRYSVSCAHIKL